MQSLIINAMLQPKSSMPWAGTIVPPHRSSIPGLIVILTVVAVISIAMMVPMDYRWLSAALVTLAGIAVVLRSIYALHVALLFSIWVLPAGFSPILRQWPLRILLPLAIYAAVVAFVPALRHTIGWLRTGTWDRTSGTLVALTAVLSGAALMMWVALFNPDLERHLVVLRMVPLWAYPLAAAGFALFNAALEEVVFRGVMMEALDSALGEGYLSIGLQAISFAAFHYVTGFPNGIAGFVMVLIYGLMLGMLRRRARGLLAPWAAHVAADAVIFGILAVMHLKG
jgi:uncharacterized protein